MDSITTEVQKKEQDHTGKRQGKKCGLEEQVQLNREESGSEKKKREYVSKEVQDKRKIEGRCIKCRGNNHQSTDWKVLSRAKTSLFPGNANQELVQKKRKFDKGHLKIMELSLEEDSRNT